MLRLVNYIPHAEGRRILFVNFIHPNQFVNLNARDVSGLHLFFSFFLLLKKFGTAPESAPGGLSGAPGDSLDGPWMVPG